MESFKEVIQVVWTALNTPAGVAFIASVFIYILNKLFSYKPTWKKIYEKWEGSLVSAIKFAEKTIDDKSENKSQRKLDQALKYMIKVFEDTKGRMPKRKELEAIKEGLNKKHSELDT